MKAAWDWIFSYSIQGTGLILLALLARICLQKSPAVFRYVLWMLVFVGLICPWRMELPVAPKEVVSLVLPLDQETEQGEAAPWAQTSEPVLPVAPEERAVTSRVAEAKKKRSTSFDLGSGCLWRIGIWIMGQLEMEKKVTRGQRSGTQGLGSGRIADGLCVWIAVQNLSAGPFAKRGAGLHFAP